MESGIQQAREQAANRLRSGMFRPGQSGNPGGRRKKTPEQRIVEEATRRTLDAFLEKRLGKALDVVDRCLKADDAALALRAAVDVLDRVGGKAVQRTELNAQVSTDDRATSVTPEMLRAAAMRLLAAGAVDVVDAQEVARAGD